jgi:hypothetical protein
MVEIAENPSIVTKLLIFQNNYFQIIKIWIFKNFSKHSHLAIHFLNIRSKLHGFKLHMLDFKMVVGAVGLVKLAFIVTLELFGLHFNCQKKSQGLFSKFSSFRIRTMSFLSVRECGAVCRCHHELLKYSNDVNLN